MRITQMIVLLGIFVVLPIIIVALVARAKTNATNKRAEIALAAIEKNSDVNLEEFFKKMNPSRRCIMERLLDRLLCGCIFTFFGVGIYIAIFVHNFYPLLFIEQNSRLISALLSSLMIAFSIVAVLNTSEMVNRIRCSSPHQSED